MPQRPGTLTVSCCHSPGLLPLGVARKVGLRTGAPPSTPTRGVPSGHLGGERSPILAHWLHHDGYGGGKPLVVHLRREEEVISADDGHAESGCSAEEGAQRLAAARLGAGGREYFLPPGWFLIVIKQLDGLSCPLNFCLFLAPRTRARRGCSRAFTLCS